MVPYMRVITSTRKREASKHALYAQGADVHEKRIHARNIKVVD
jgi:hypothetical protein